MSQTPLRFSRNDHCLLLFCVLLLLQRSGVVLCSSAAAAVSSLSSTTTSTTPTTCKETNNNNNNDNDADVTMPPSAPTTPQDEQDLPRWDLETRFGFSSPFDKAVDAHLEETKAMAKAFRETYEGKLESCVLLQAIQEYESIASRRALIGSYLSLSYDVKLDDDGLKKRKGALSQIQSAIAGDYLEWFTLDVAGLSQPVLDAHYVATPGLTKYKAFLEELQRQKPHDLSKDVERALTVRSPYTGTRPLVSFFW